MINNEMTPALIIESIAALDYISLDDALAIMHAIRDNFPTLELPPIELPATYFD
jgi:hypothetical protein